MTAKHSHYNWENIASGKTYSHTPVVFWAKWNMKVKIKRKICGVLLDSSDFQLSFIQPLSAVSAAVLRRLFCRRLSVMRVQIYITYLTQLKGGIFQPVPFLSFCLINLISLSLHSWIICQWFQDAGWNTNAQNIFIFKLRSVDFVLPHRQISSL